MSNQTVNLDEAQTRLADLIAIASDGNEVIIMQDGKPMARLVPATPIKSKRIAGLNRGSIWTSQDFDESLPDDFWTGQE